MRFIKKILITLTLLFALLGTFLFIFSKTINLKSIKDYLNKEISLLTEQQSEILGDVSWQLLPEPGVKISKVKIGEENNQQNYSAYLDNLIFRLNITELLQGKISFNELIVNGFVIHVNAFAHEDNTKKTFIAPPEPSEFTIKKILLSQGQIDYKKEAKLIKFLNLQIGADNFNLQQKAFSLQLKGNLELLDNEKKIIKTQFIFKGTSTLNKAFLKNPLQHLKDLPFEGQLNLSKLFYKKFKIDSLETNIKLVESSLLLNPLSLSLYNGESIGSLNYNLKNSSLMLYQTAINLDSSPIIKALFKKDIIEGKLDFSLHSSFNLNSDNWLETATGNGNLAIHKGTIKTINLNKIVDETANKISNLMKGIAINIASFGQFDNPEFYKGGTPFSLMSLQYVLENQKIQNHSFVLQTDKLQINGDFSLDLKSDALKGQLFTKVNLNNIQIDQIQNLLGGNFPLLLSGSLSDPSFEPDMTKINPILSKAWLKESLTLPVKPLENILKLIFHQP
ncbi:MAG: AsmA family protein [Proteobacteria bacterium]|nr:AsmA family protein [Pseudomonadota bacterium]